MALMDTIVLLGSLLALVAGIFLPTYPIEIAILMLMAIYLGDA